VQHALVDGDVGEQLVTGRLRVDPARGRLRARRSVVAQEVDPDCDPVPLPTEPYVVPDGTTVPGIVGSQTMNTSSAPVSF
jgi:hypothetical protein